MYASRVIGENVRKISKNGNLKTQIYEANDISSCRALNSEQNAVFLSVTTSHYFSLLTKATARKYSPRTL